MKYSEISRNRTSVIYKGEVVVSLRTFPGIALRGKDYLVSCNGKRTSINLRGTKTYAAREIPMKKDEFLKYIGILPMLVEQGRKIWSLDQFQQFAAEAAGMLN